MRRAYRLLYSSLARTHLSSHPHPHTQNPLSNPSSIRYFQYPLSRLVQSLSHNPIPPSSDSDERRTGLDCLTEAERILSNNNPQPQNLEKALDFGVRALTIFEKSDGGWSVQVAKSLLLLGKISFKLRKYEESLESLSASLEILNGLEGVNESHCEIGLLIVEVNTEIAKVKRKLGKRWEALGHLKTALEHKIKILGPNNKQLGTDYADLAEGYMYALNHNDGLPLCLKALEIQTSEFGPNSLEVAKVRELIGALYTGLGNYAESIEQDIFVKSIYDRLNMAKESVQTEIDTANVLILTGQLEEATEKLRDAISRVDKESELKAFALETMAKVLCNREQFSDAKRCLEIALEIFEKYETVLPDKVAGAYADIGMLYESMAEFEVSVSLYKRSLSILREHEEMHQLEGSVSSRLGWLLLHMQRVDLAVPYLEMAIGRLEGCLSKRHFGLGFAYKHLGMAYLETGRHEMAVEYLGYAREIIEETFGFVHDDSIDVNQCLANAYGTMGSYKVAMEFQQRVVDAYKKRGNESRDDLREAYRLLEQLRKKIEGNPAAVFPAYSLPASLPPPPKK